MAQLEFLRALCGLSFANFAVKGSCSRAKSKDSNRKVREDKAAKCAKKLRLSHALSNAQEKTGGTIGPARMIRPNQLHSRAHFRNAPFQHIDGDVRFFFGDNQRR